MYWFFIAPPPGLRSCGLLRLVAAVAVVRAATSSTVVIIVLFAAALFVCLLSRRFSSSRRRRHDGTQKSKSRIRAKPHDGLDQERHYYLEQETGRWRLPLHAQTTAPDYKRQKLCAFFLLQNCFPIRLTITSHRLIPIVHTYLFFGFERTMGSVI